MKNKSENSSLFIAFSPKAEYLQIVISGILTCPASYPSLSVDVAESDFGLGLTAAGTVLDFHKIP